MDGVADQRVKPELLRDTFSLIDFEPVDVHLEKAKAARIKPNQSKFGMANNRRKAEQMQNQRTSLGHDTAKSNLKGVQSTTGQPAQAPFFDRRSGAQAANMK